MFRKTSLVAKANRVGYLFLLPWLIGIIFFFVIPFFKAFIYAFSEVDIGSDGIMLSLSGFDNISYILLQDPNFNRLVVESVKNMLINVPLIMFFSIFVALILNQKFIGRGVARAIFFLPVIIASGMVINVIKSDVFVASGMSENSTIFQTNTVREMLYQMNLGDEIVQFFSQMTSQTFDLTWKSGLQVLLYLSAIQTIPVEYYEVAAVEGANSWDAFWAITFPILSPTSLLVVIYTIIDTFADFNNKVMKQILQRIENLRYGYASASALIYFIVIAAVLGLVYLFAKRRLFYRGD